MATIEPDLRPAPPTDTNLTPVTGARAVAPEWADVAPVPRVPRLDAARTIPVTREATVLWSQVRACAAARYGPTQAAYVEDLAAFDLVGDTLTCVTGTEFTLGMLEGAGLAPIESELRAATGGRISSLRLEVFRPERHEGRRSIE